jgi:hypothetical protein
VIQSRRRSLAVSDEALTVPELSRVKRLQAKGENGRNTGDAGGGGSGDRRGG